MVVMASTADRCKRRTIQGTGGAHTEHVFCSLLALYLHSHFYANMYALKEMEASPRLFELSGCKKGSEKELTILLYLTLSIYIRFIIGYTVNYHQSKHTVAKTWLTATYIGVNRYI